jgi:hypothetical protein
MGNRIRIVVRIIEKQGYNSMPMRQGLLGCMTHVKRIVPGSSKRVDSRRNAENEEWKQPYLSYRSDHKKLLRLSLSMTQLIPKPKRYLDAFNVGRCPTSFSKCIRLPPHVIGRIDSFCSAAGDSTVKR